MRASHPQRSASPFSSFFAPFVPLFTLLHIAGPLTTITCSLLPQGRTATAKGGGIGRGRRRRARAWARTREGLPASSSLISTTSPLTGEYTSDAACATSQSGGRPPQPPIALPAAAPRHWPGPGLAGCNLRPGGGRHPSGGEGETTRLLCGVLLAAAALAGLWCAPPRSRRCSDRGRGTATVHLAAARRTPRRGGGSPRAIARGGHGTARQARTFTDSTTPKVSFAVTSAPTSGSSTYTTSPSSLCGRRSPISTRPHLKVTVSSPCFMPCQAKRRPSY